MTQPHAASQPREADAVVIGAGAFGSSIAYHLARLGWRNMARLAVYLASDEAAVVTGGMVPIDSGYMAFQANVDIMGAMRAGAARETKR